MPRSTNGGNGQIRTVALVLSTAAGIGGVSYGMVSSRLDDRCETISAQIAATRAEIARDSARLDREEGETSKIIDRMARMETKLDTILDEVKRNR